MEVEEAEEPDKRIIIIRFVVRVDLAAAETAAEAQE
jgi:hypothetical protein